MTEIQKVSKNVSSGTRRQDYRRMHDNNFSTIFIVEIMRKNILIDFRT